MPIMMLIVEILLIIIAIKWKTWKQTENCRKSEKSPQPTGNWLRGNWKHSENSRIYSVFFSKKLPPPLPSFRILREDGAIKVSNLLKMVGHLYKKQPENWLAKSPIFDDTAKKKAVTSFSSQSYGGDDQIWTGEWRFCRPLPYHLATSPYKWKLMFTNLHCFLERPTRLELATSTLARWRSTRWATAAGCVFFAKNTQEMVPPIGIEPMTRGFSVPCSTDWATEANGDPNQARTDDL